MRSHLSNFTTHAAGLLLCGLALPACDLEILLGEFGETASPTQGTSDETESASSTGDSQGPGSTTSTGDPSTSGTTGEPDPSSCDPWQQDCPAGQKCAPYTTFEGPTFDAFRCIDIAPDPQPPGSSCQPTGPFASGEDNCELGAVCWDIDPDTDEGTCVALCEGSLQSPSCPSGTYCVHMNDDVLNLCLAGCDPLSQNCDPGQACIQHPNDPGEFICVLDASGSEGQALDPCEFANACDPGLSCVQSATSVECDPADVGGCCTPYCDLTATNTCPGSGQVCLPLYDVGQAPAGKEDIGFCGLAP